LKKQENKEEKLTLTNLSQFAEITFPGEPRQEPLTASYGIRDFIIHDPGGNQLAFGCHA